MIVGKRERVKFDENGNEIKKPTRFYSDKHEKKVADIFNGRQIKNSGAGAFDKSDVSTDLFLFECKTHTTDKESTSIKKEWIEKNTEESLYMGKPYSALVFNFGPSSKNYYVIDETLMKYLVKKLEEEDNLNVQASK